MAEKNFYPKLGVGLAVLFLSLAPMAARAQYQNLSSPVTSSAPDGSMTDRERHMQEVRRSAQQVQGDAAAASMARSADRSLEEQNRQRALQEARELKAIKREEAERLKWERSNARARKVTASDMSTWETPGGGVRVQREVPNSFIASLIAEEEEAERRGTLEPEVEKKKRFSPSDLNPFKKDREPASTGTALARSGDSSPSPEDGGFFDNMRLPKIGFPKFGKRDQADEGPPPEAPVFRQTSDAPRQAAPTQASSTQAAPVPSGTVASSDGASRVQRRSGAEMVDGRAAPAAPRTQSPRSGSAQPRLASFDNSRSNDGGGGLFSAFKLSNSGSSSGGVPEKRGGGLFSFGKKKPEADSIDSSLFPEAVGESEPIVPSSSGARETQTNPYSGEFASGSSESGGSREVSSEPVADTVTLPGQDAPRRRGGGFSIPKPNLSFPSLGDIGDGDRDSGGSVPTMTTVNSAGTSYYAVTETAQFMVYGEDRMQSEVRALPAGRVVRMTKPGEQWASVRLPDGTEGVIQNKYLRAAAAPAAASFAETN